MITWLSEGSFGPFERISSQSSFVPEHMFGSDGCLKADVVPGYVLSTNCLLVIGYYSRTERRAVQRATCLETIMGLAGWQTALSLDKPLLLSIFSWNDELWQKKVNDTKNILMQSSWKSNRNADPTNTVVICHEYPLWKMMLLVERVLNWHIKFLFSLPKIIHESSTW